MPNVRCQMSGFLLYFHGISNVIGNKQKVISPFIEEDRQHRTVQEEGPGYGIILLRLTKSLHLGQRQKSLSIMVQANKTRANSEQLQIHRDCLPGRCEEVNS